MQIHHYVCTYLLIKERERDSEGVCTHLHPQHPLHFTHPAPHAISNSPGLRQAIKRRPQMPGLTRRFDWHGTEDHTFQEQPPFRWDSLSDTVSNFKQNSKGKEDYTFYLPKSFHNTFVNYPVISKECIHINGSFPQFHLGIRRLQWHWGLLWVVILGIYPNFVTI